MSVLLVAGLDSSTGAGLARDLAVLTDHGVAARIAATAVTAQDGAGACHVHAVPPGMIAAQIRAAGPVRAAKIGMLANSAIVTAVADALPRIPFVLDSVLATSAGAALLDAGGRAAMIARLFPRAALVTPNLPEAAALTGLTVDTQPEKLADAIFALGARAVLIKGGHGEGAVATDWLFQRCAPPLRLSAPRKLGSRRGTGCTLSSAIAAHLAHADDLARACAEAKAYVNTWL